MGKKDSIVAGLTDGVAFLFKKNKVDYRVGTGTIDKMDADGGQVNVTDAKGATSQLVTQRILIATGSVPATCRAWSLTKNASSPRPAPSLLSKCRSIWWSSAPA